MRIRSLPAALFGTAGVLLLGAGALAVTDAGASAAPAPPAAAAPARPAGTGSLTDAIAAAQVRLRKLPADHLTWAQLGSAYVQQARVTGDPSYYPKAEGALRESLQLSPEGNTAAMLGLGALANARHEFTQALDWGTKAQASDPYSAGVQGVIADARTQLGDAAGAEAAVQRMLDLDPGLPALTRASYAFEQRGDVAGARSALERALKEASDPADVAFCRTYLAELDLNSGRPAAALESYGLALAALPTYDPAVAGRARAAAALGRSGEALRDYAAVVGRTPLPEYVLEYGQLLESLGRPAEAKAQYALLDSIQQLFAANGVVDDLTAAAFEADHGSPALAVRHARAEWDRRHNVLVADALAWALHRDGKDAEALGYAKQASRLGWRNATFAYHQGMIELALGQREAARSSLSRAMAINPHFSPLQAPAAARALASLGGAR